nr:7091_t:CDS:2 [Entrophospora candida]CAG8604101.1 259_t:CDS:2 [Entrophospora candida]
MSRFPNTRIETNNLNNNRNEEVKKRNLKDNFSFNNDILKLTSADSSKPQRLHNFQEGSVENNLPVYTTTTTNNTNLDFLIEASITVENNNNVDNSCCCSKSESGLEYWNRQRELWTRENSDGSGPFSNKNNPALVNFTPKNYNKIYDSLIYGKKKLSKPIPLPYVIKVLVSGWKRDGIWPSDQPSPTSSTNAQVPL